MAKPSYLFLELRDVISELTGRAMKEAELLRGSDRQSSVCDRRIRVLDKIVTQLQSRVSHPQCRPHECPEKNQDTP